MKLVIVAPGLLPVPASQGGAVEQLIDSYIKESLLRSDDVLTVFSGADIKKEITIRKGRVTYIQIPILQSINFGGKYGVKLYHHLRYRKYLNRIKTWLQFNEYDAVLIENRPQFVETIASVSKSPIYLHLHNEEFSRNPEKYKKVPDICKKILVVSNYIKEKIEDEYGCQNVSVVYNGIDIDRFKKENDKSKRDLLRKKYGINLDGFVIVFQGRFKEEKGVLELVQAFSKCQEKNMELVIIGATWFGTNDTTPYIMKVKEQASHCTNKIIFTGYLKNEQVAEVDSVADLAVIPSMWDDPCPLTVIEAMSSSLPIIATESGGIPEMCTNQNGILLKRDAKLVDNLYNAIINLYSDKSMYKDFAINSRLRVEKEFSNTKYYYSLRRKIGID